MGRAIAQQLTADGMHVIVHGRDAGRRSQAEHAALAVAAALVSVAIRGSAGR